MALETNGHPDEKLDSLDNIKEFDQDEDVFEDAVDQIEDKIEEGLEAQQALDFESPPSLNDAVEEILICLEMALQNKFNEAYVITKKWAHVSIYHALGKATLCFLQAILTLEPDTIKAAMSAIKGCMQLCQRRKKQTNPMLKVVFKPNYDTYIEEETHAELCYAEAEMLIAFLTFIQDQSFLNLAKGGLRVRSCYQSYKETRNILKNRTIWTDSVSKDHFESGVRMGFGVFNLVISLLPSKAIKILELVGFSGNRKYGMSELTRAIEIQNGLRAILANFSMLLYQLYLQQAFAPNDVDYPLCKKLLVNSTIKYPDSAFLLLFEGRLSQITGNISEAIASLNKCIKVQNEWKQIHNVCYWELLWCHVCRCEWKEATHYADLLRKHCAWSPGIYTYLYAVLLCMRADETGDKSLIEKAMFYFKEVPKLRVRIGGKTIPAEKFAIIQSEKFVNNVKPIMLPIFDYVYIWNIFLIIAKDKKLIAAIVDCVEKKLKEYEHEKDSETGPLDNYASLLFIKAVCYRYMGCPLQAKKDLINLIENEKRIVRDTFLLPFTCLELGYTLIKLKDYNLAETWLEKGRKEYSGFLLETPFQIKVHSALKHVKKVRNQQKMTQEDSQSVSSNDIDKCKKGSKEFQTSLPFGKTYSSKVSITKSLTDLDIFEANQKECKFIS